MSGVQRQSHPKTRTGCKVCKRRKIKCGEQRPSCNNCIKHSVQCDYLLARLPGTPGTPSSSHQEYSRSSSSAANALLPAPESQPSSRDNGAPPALQMLQLQMLHHYTTSTCFTIPGSSMLKTLMKTTIPQLAFSHEFVMRGIFSFSALHLAYCQPERRDFWTAQAMIEHRAASAVAMSVLTNVTVENCSALYVFAMLTTFFALASPRKAGDLFLIGENAEWLFLLRGIRSIMEMSTESLVNSPLGPMFAAGARRSQLRQEQTEQNYLEELEMYIATTADPQTHHIYRHAIEDLKQSYNAIYANAPADLEMADIFIWPYRVMDEYLILLRQHTQESLLIFAYFCVLLKRLEGYWWMRDRSTQLIARIYDLLNEECRLCIRWPMEEIGWAPGTPRQP